MCLITTLVPLKCLELLVTAWASTLLGGSSIKIQLLGLPSKMKDSFRASQQSDPDTSVNRDCAISCPGRTAPSPIAFTWVFQTSSVLSLRPDCLYESGSSLQRNK